MHDEAASRCVPRRGRTSDARPNPDPNAFPGLRRSVQQRLAIAVAHEQNRLGGALPGGTRVTDDDRLVSLEIAVVYDDRAGSPRKLADFHFRGLRATAPPNETPTAIHVVVRQPNAPCRELLERHVGPTQQIVPRAGAGEHRVGIGARAGVEHSRCDGHDAGDHVGRQATQYCLVGDHFLPLVLQAHEVRLDGGREGPRERHDTWLVATKAFAVLLGDDAGRARPPRCLPARALGMQGPRHELHARLVHEGAARRHRQLHVRARHRDAVNLAQMTAIGLPGDGVLLVVRPAVHVPVLVDQGHDQLPALFGTIVPHAHGLVVGGQILVPWLTTELQRLPDLQPRRSFHRGDEEARGRRTTRTPRALPWQRPCQAAV
mmetsp:Transcript_47094/g.131379  ORF Transcript_47094/g.131379 Transcript_47094/m.131379 type:complete len:375 (+) Transcript_47094:1376-2500(+)